MSYEYSKLNEQVKKAIRVAGRHQYLLATANFMKEATPELQETASLSEDKVYNLIYKLYGECTCTKSKDEVWHACRSYDQHVIASNFLDDCYEVAYLNASIDYPENKSKINNVIKRTLIFLEDNITM
jgi:hypothetical protein